MVESNRTRMPAEAAFLALMVLVIVAVFGLTAAPAGAFSSWQHDTTALCGFTGCHGLTHHANWAPSDADCTSCHTGGFTTPRQVYSTYCWDCHALGQDDVATWKTSSGCTGTCHLAAAPLEEDCDSCHYASSRGLTFSHGTNPHPGADSAPCTSCHAVSVSVTDPGNSPHHGGTPPSVDDCLSCHDGTLGSLKVNHDGITDCQTCHNGMDIPAVPAKCNTCHTPAQVGTGACTAASCHGTAVIHTATPSATSACADCHGNKTTGHYETLGTCATCHKDIAGYHHGGVQAIPLAQCVTCHNGTIASAKVNHDGLSRCTGCHSGMNLPTVPTACNSCHTAAQFGTGACTSSSCHTTGALHTATPGLGKVCVDCHTGKASGHYNGLGTCKTCHTNVAGYHHAGAKAIPLAQCATCHDGGIASAKVSHDGIATCAYCHTQGMDIPPVPSTCNTCHVSQQFGTGICSGCHGSGVIHDATPSASAACTDCHANKASGHFETLGACVTCHTNVPGYHHAGAKAIPLAQCATCHDGGIASAPLGHQSFGTNCTACHTGMSRPAVTDCAGCHNGTSASLKVNHDGITDCQTCHNGMDIPAVPAKCNACHTATQFGTGSCTAASCHGTSVIHTATPGTGAACTDCHTEKASGHFDGIAACADCHTDVAGYHHAGEEAVPLAQCATCHDGAIASEKQSHDGITTCASCHNGMDRPVQAVLCRQCHFRSAKVTLPTCTTCHSGSGMFAREQIHTATPSAGATCTTCHSAHFAELGSCGTCHPQADKAHHDLTTMTASALTLNAGPPAVTIGGSATLTGSLSVGGAPAAGETVTIESRVSLVANFVPMTTVTTAADGGFSFTVSPTARTTYRAVWIGLGTADGVIQPAAVIAVVEVRPLISLRLANAASRVGSYQRYPLGRRVLASGEVKPNHAQLGDGATKGAVTLAAQQHRYSKTLKRWVWTTVARASRPLDSSSRYTWAWKPKARGAYRMRAKFAADVDHLAATSSYRYLRVY